MRRWCTGVLTLGLLGMPSCSGRDVEGRVRQLEQRVGALEEAVARAPRAPVPHQATTDLRDLERRLATLEERMASGTVAHEGALAPGPAAPAASRIEQRRERRARLREVTEQYRDRLAAIRESQADPAARQQAVRDALEWYRAQRRAILAGEQPPGQ
jgi:chromosome segregation ATPase